MWLLFFIVSFFSNAQFLGFLLSAFGIDSDVGICTNQHLILLDLLFLPASSLTPIVRYMTMTANGSTNSTSVSIPSPSVGASTSLSTAVSKSDDTNKDTADPFQLRDRVLSEEQLAGLRSRFRPNGAWGKFGGIGMGIVGSSGTRRGRALEEYHVRQNNVRVSVALLSFRHILVLLPFYELWAREDV